MNGALRIATETTLVVDDAVSAVLGGWRLN
jgi:hypothetical protein